MTPGAASQGGSREAAEKALLDWLNGLSDEDGVTHEVGARAGEYVVTLPGERKLKTTVSVIVGDRAMSLSAFVIRHPDENEGAFHKWLLERNLRLPGAAFAVDSDGDVYLVGRLPLEGVTVESVDELMGVLAASADESFNELLVLGFFSSMQKEWDWRISRGESTRNLEAFRHLLERDS
jgi:hypothetical protein